MTDPYDRLPNPDEVGQAEYRIVHKLVTDLKESGADYLLIQAALDELSRWSRKAMLEYVRETNVY